MSRFKRDYELENAMKIKNLGVALLLTAWGVALGIGMAQASEDTLWQDMGGVDHIKKIASDTLDNFLTDDRIKNTFSNSNIERIRVKLGEQFCVIAGGPCQYTGHSMEATHRGLRLTNADFNAVVEDLQKAMAADGVPFATQNRFLARLAPMEHTVVTR
jgi:hemoglobin